MFTTVSARQIQREYKKILAQANRKTEPIVVISNNKLQGAIIGLDLLEKIRLQAVADEAMEEYKKGKTKTISTLRGLEEDLEQMRSARTTNTKNTDLIGNFISRLFQ